MNSIEMLQRMIKGCEDVITDCTEDKDENIRWLAKEVKKDCQGVIRQIQLEQGRIA